LAAATISAGIRFRTTTAIRIRGVIDIRIGIAGRITPAADGRLIRTAVLVAEDSGRRTRLAAVTEPAVVLVNR
jgi:hypothetical protein